jgi:glycosyltransferase involved in cell wall biosynthesis
VPVRDEERTLPALWTSILGQTLQPSEIIIVDGGSRDGTVALARSLAGDDTRVRVIEAGDATPGRGRNVGIEAARNEWIALTDAGIRLNPDWLERLVRVVEADPSRRIVYGDYEPIVRTFFDRCAALAYVTPPQDTPAGPMRGPIMASALLSKEAWAAAGTFPDLRSGEDILFMARIRELGIPAGWAPDAIVWWEMRPTLRSTYGRFRLFSYNAVHTGLTSDWHKPVGRAYLAGAGLLLLAQVRGRGWAVLAALGAAARIESRIWRRRGDHSWLWALDPLQFIGVAVVGTTIDVATFVGWGQAVVARMTRSSQLGGRPGTAGGNGAAPLPQALQDGRRTPVEPDLEAVLSQHDVAEQGGAEEPGPSAVPPSRF